MTQPDNRSFNQQADAAFKLAATDVLRIARQTGTPVIVGDGDSLNAISADQYEKELTLREGACLELGRQVKDIAPKDDISGL